MERKKPQFDILGRMEQGRLARGWSEYALAEDSGIARSAISTRRRKNLRPNVASIEKICAGFGITHSQFFRQEESTYLSGEQAEIRTLWAKLSPKQRKAVLTMLKSFLEEETR